MTHTDGWIMRELQRECWWQRQKKSTISQIVGRVDCYMHACPLACPRCLIAWHRFASELRAKLSKKERSRSTLWSLSLCLFDAPCGNKPADFGTRWWWCWVLKWTCASPRGCRAPHPLCTCMCVCNLCEGTGVYPSDDCANLSREIPNEHACTHTHTSRHSLPYFIEVNCIQAGGNVKGFTLYHGYQTSRRLWQTQLSSKWFTSSRIALWFFWENVISHLCLGRNSKAVQQDIASDFGSMRGLTTLPTRIPRARHSYLLPNPCPLTAPQLSSPFLVPSTPLIPLSSLPHLSGRFSGLLLPAWFSVVRMKQ